MGSKKTCKKHGKSCYAIMLNGDGKDPCFSMEVCPKCDAHLAPSGICLNACHLSDESRERFAKLMESMAARTRREETGGK